MFQTASNIDIIWLASFTECCTYVVETQTCWMTYI